MPLSANLSAAAAMSLLAMTALLRPAGGVVNNFGEGVRVGEGEQEGTVLKENNTINVDKPGESSRQSELPDSIQSPLVCLSYHPVPET